MVELVRRTATWTRRGTVEDALAAVEGVGAERGGRIQKIGDDAVTLCFGSRLGYRFLGAYLERGRRAVPYKVSVTAVALDGGRTKLTAEAVSDEGPALVRLDKGERLLGERVSEILDVLQRL